jgi:hypothetical protein
MRNFVVRECNFQQKLENVTKLDFSVNLFHRKKEEQSKVTLKSQECNFIAFSLFLVQ